MSLSLSSTIILVIIGFFLGMWTGTHLDEATAYLGRLKTSIGETIRGENCPEHMTCMPAFQVTPIPSP